MDIVDAERLKKDEEEFRAVLQNVLAAVFVAIASLLLLVVVPFLPLSVAVLWALLLGVIAYKSPVVAIPLMFASAIPGFIYQFQLPVVMFAVMGSILFLVGLGVRRAGTTLGIATGAIAAVLMLTPVYFLAIPLMVAVPLFCARGKKVGVTGAILVFLVLYLPMLRYGMGDNISGGDPSVVPLFERITMVHPQPTISLSDFLNIGSALGDRIPHGTLAERAYLNWVNYYIPTFREGHIGQFLIIVLGVFLGIGIAGAFGDLALLRWVHRREPDWKFLPWVGPAVALVIAVVVFLIPLQTLSGSLSYDINISTVGALGLIGSAALFGGAGSGVEYWLGIRDLTVKLRQELVEAIPPIRAQIEQLQARIKQTTALCQGINLNAEQIAANKAEQELSFGSADTSGTSVQTLSEKADMFRSLRKQLSGAFEETFRKLCRFHDESRSRFNEHARMSGEFGYPLGDAAIGPSLSQLTSLEYEKVVAEQAGLNARYQQGAESLVKSASDLETTLRLEIDPGFNPVGIDIARNYFAQGNYDGAIDTALADLSNIDRLVASLAEGLEHRVDSAAKQMTHILRDSLIPVIYAVGDPSDVHRYSSIMKTLDGLSSPTPETRRLPDLLLRIKKTRELGDLTASVVTDMGDRISQMERDIEAKIPRGYNWAKNPYILGEINGLLATYRETSGWADVNIRMSRVENALKIIADGALALRQYGSFHEFLINYINIEYLVQEKLEKHGELTDTGLPVRQSYAQQYLKLFRDKNSSRVLMEPATGRLYLKAQA